MADKDKPTTFDVPKDWPEMSGEERRQWVIETGEELHERETNRLASIVHRARGHSGPHPYDSAHIWGGEIVASTEGRVYLYDVDPVEHHVPLAHLAHLSDKKIEEGVRDYIREVEKTKSRRRKEARAHEKRLLRQRLEAMEAEDADAP